MDAMTSGASRFCCASRPLCDPALAPALRMKAMPALLPKAVAGSERRQVWEERDELPIFDRWTTALTRSCSSIPTARVGVTPETFSRKAVVTRAARFEQLLNQSPHPYSARFLLASAASGSEATCRRRAAM